MQARKSSPLQKLILHEEAMARGASIQGVNANEEAAAPTISTLMRSFRGRADLADLVLETGGLTHFAESIEWVRNALATGDLERARKFLSSIEPKSGLETGEILLEWTKFHVMSGNFGEALRVSDEALRISELADTSRMTLHQVRGHCFVVQKNYDDAISELRQALKRAEQFSLAGPAFSARAFLVQAYAETAREREAEDTLKELHESLEGIGHEELWLDRLLTVVRSEVHFYRAKKDYGRCSSALDEAAEIARFLNDQTTLAKCEKEKEELPKVARDPDSVCSFSGWSFLPKREAVLIRFPRSLQRFQRSPVATKILIELSRVGREGLREEVLFQKVWELAYHPERHGVHLRSALSKLRKLLPKGAIRTVEGIISLH